MLPESKRQTLLGLKRLQGLIVRVEQMIQDEEYCPKILEQVLAMKGHIKHVQSKILESHLQTCARKRMSTDRGSRHFVQDLIHAIGLSTR